VQEKLDRAVANKEWYELDPTVDVLVEAGCSSNILPILLILQKQDYDGHRRRGFC
jgi:hypothetical protein